MVVRAEEILLYPLSALILIFSAYVFANPVNSVTRLPQYLSVPLSATDIRCVDNPYKSVLGFAVRTGKDFSHALVLRTTVSAALVLSRPLGSRLSALSVAQPTVESLRHRKMEKLCNSYDVTAQTFREILINPVG